MDLEQKGNETLYYTIEDVMKMTGSKYDKCSEIVRNLNKKYKKEFPLAETIQGKILKWFYEKAMGIQEKEFKGGV